MLSLSLFLGYKAFQNRQEKEKWEKDDQLPEQDHKNKEEKRIILARLVVSVYKMHKKAKRTAAVERNTCLDNQFWMNFNWSEECSDLWSDNYDLVDFDLARLTKVLKSEDRLQVEQALDNCAKDLVNFAVFHRKEGAHELAPEWVVAIRGTATKRDILPDLKIFFERLHTSGLVKMLQITVNRLCEDYGQDNVCVTGHSLGAAAGLSVTRKMAVDAVVLDTHLFNPPFLPMETIAHFSLIMINPVYFLVAKAISPEIKRKVVNSVKQRIFRVVDKKHYQQSENEYDALMAWRPHLYVNINDPICSEYAYYFRQHNLTQEQEAKKGNKQMCYSLGNLVSRLVFGCAETFHLIPVATLCLDTTSSGKNPLKAHKLKNWTATPPPKLCYKTRFEVHSKDDKTVDQTGEIHMIVEGGDSEEAVDQVNQQLEAASVIVAARS
ncbi:hypothetical protein Mapa_013591 [Marchantia paleacea]|nr:hypothetical protein Mapa_013591 [Marchantia paleacea]